MADTKTKATSRARSRKAAKGQAAPANGAPAPAAGVAAQGLSDADLQAEIERRGLTAPAGGDASAGDPEGLADKIRALLPERDHQDGCAAERVELAGNVRPARPKDGIPARRVTVVRCVDCGGQTVLDEDRETVVARLNDDE